MEAFLISMSAVAIAEIGDKTQLLSLVLASQFKKPLPIIAGIFVATILNHAMAAFLGVMVAQYLTPNILHWVLGISFLAAAAWMLIPDKMDDVSKTSRFGPFLTTTIAFFIAEIGDKTEIATIGLAARFDDVTLVAAGTTLGMMLANVPVVFLGDAAAKALPLKAVRLVAAGIFVLLGIHALLQALKIL